jgi:diacylglycerol O-acyltransferase
MSDPDPFDIEFAPRMSDADALMWNIEKDPMLRSTITSISLLDQAPDRERLLRTIDRATRIVPRLRQRVRGRPYSIAPPRWDLDPNFDLDYHLRFVSLGGSGTEQDVRRLAQPLAMQGFDRARPLWEFHVVEGLVDGRAAMIQKVHHAITDGVGGVKLQLELVDLERHPASERPMPDAPAVHVASDAERVVDALTWEARRQAQGIAETAAMLGSGLREATQDPVGVAMSLLNTATSVARWLSPTTRPLSPLMAERSLSVHFSTITLRIDDLKAAARVAGGKLNDAFVAGVIGGFQAYHEKLGAPVPTLRMAMPINVRTDATATKAGNQFAPARTEVPTDLPDPIARMTAVRELVDHLRREPVLALTEPLAGVVNRLPTSITTSVFGAMLRGIDFTTSNVPGAPFPVYLGGAQVLAQFAFGPMAGAGANVTLLSYQDEVHIGVNVDPAAVTHPELLLECLRDSFAEICKLA